MMRTHGTVKWFNSTKGYGFVTTDDGQDIFIHYSFIQDEGYQTLNENESVTFEIEEHEKGPWAINLRRETQHIEQVHKVTDKLPTQITKHDIPRKEPFLNNISSQVARPLRVFLCHSSGDKPVVRSLHKRLISTGFEPWLDEVNLLPGQEWSQEISKAVFVSDVVLVCLSNSSINKAGFVQKEIKLALDVADEQPEGTIFLIPLKLEECDVPERLRRWQWVNLFEPGGFKKLITALEVRAMALGSSERK